MLLEAITRSTVRNAEEFERKEILGSGRNIKLFSHFLAETNVTNKKHDKY